MIDYLNAPPSYWNASHQVREAVCNGAGPWGYGRLVPDRILGLCITEPAKIHDWEYWKGRSEEDKRNADSNFLTNMIWTANRETTRFFLVGFVLRLLRRHLVLYYYEAVHEFGHRAFWATRFSEE